MIQASMIQGGDDQRFREYERFGSQIVLQTFEDEFFVLNLLPASSDGLFVINEETLGGLEDAVGAMERSSGHTGLIVIGNSRGFIAGADVELIAEVSSADEAQDFAKRGQNCFARFEALPFPTLAAIHGPCLGGGLEFALALEQRICTRSKSSKLGLPEVQLGILPGFGGTQRLPRLIGLPKALDLMLTGKKLDGRRAKKAGLVDRVVPDEKLFEAAVQQLRMCKKPARKWRRMDRILSRSKLGRKLVRKQVEKKLERGQARFFTAPRKILDLAIMAFEADPAKAYEAEARAVGELAVSPTCKSLIRIFFGMERARKRHKKLDPDTPAIERVLVIGGGVMGAGIACVMAEKNIRVRLVDPSMEALERATSRLLKNLGKKLKRRRITAHEARAARDRFCPSTELTGIANTDLVLEAVAEDMALKRRIFSDVSVKLPDDGILATNTSSLPLAEMAKGLAKPERLVGIHFFNPPEQMQLVEIIRHEKTSDQALARACRLATELGKFPVLVKDRPGFCVNRCLAPYLAAAVSLLEEGVAPDRVDRIIEDFGMPMGPLRLLDQVGWDVAAKVCEVLANAFPTRMSPSELFTKMQEAGLLGVKSGEGIYKYGRKGKRTESGAFQRLLKEHGLARSEPGAPNDEDIKDRLILPLLSEAFRCLEEGIVGSAEDLDFACIMGIGFPPHLGGPLHYAKARGYQRVLDRMREFEGRHGKEYEAPASLVRLAQQEGEGEGCDDVRACCPEPVAPAAQETTAKGEVSHG